MNNENFDYTYTAIDQTERKEVESILCQYSDSESKKQMTKLERIKYLDNKVKSLSCIAGLVLGILGLLIFGLGFSLVLEWDLILWGCLVSAVGIVPMAFAYPVYKKVLKREKEKYKDEIITLSKELLNGDK